MSAAVGEQAPAFALYNQNRERVSSEDLRGSNSLVVFIPFPFTGVCDGEACAIRDATGRLAELDAEVVVITTHAVPTNKTWADANGFAFDVLSDFWPHGEVASAYGAFNDALGIANRMTFVLDSAGTVRAVVATESLGTARELEACIEALAAL